MRTTGHQRIATGVRAVLVSVLATALAFLTLSALPQKMERDLGNIRPVSITELSDGTQSTPIFFDTTNATQEVGEAAGYGSLWWKYTPTSSYSIKLSTWTTIEGAWVAYCLTATIGSCTVGSSSTPGDFTLALASGTTYYLRMTSNNQTRGGFLIGRGTVIDNNLAAGDNFANAVNVPELSAGTSTAPIDVDLTNATLEGGEPSYSGVAKTAWWKYAANASYVLNVYPGRSQSNINVCATTTSSSCSLGTSSGTTRLSVTSGNTYYFRLNPNSAVRGSLVFTREAAGNDSWPNATAIPELTAGTKTAPIAVDVTGTTIETGEVVQGNANGRWWSYTTTDAQTINLTTSASENLATCLATVIGTCLTGSDVSKGVSRFSLLASTTYRLKFSSYGTNVGAFTIARQGNDNDQFANATTITELSPGATTAPITYDLTNATAEVGENLSGQASTRWWKYLPTADQVINVRMMSQASGGVLCVTTAITSCSAGTVSNQATKAYALTNGTTYYFSVASNKDSYGFFRVIREGNDNDKFANATDLGEPANNSRVLIDYSTKDATVQVGEVDWAYSTNRSRWWKFTTTSAYSITVKNGAPTGNSAVCVTVNVTSCSAGYQYFGGTVSYSLAAATTYYFGAVATGMEQGLFSITRGTFTSVGIPANDDFANATTISPLADGTQQVIDVDVTNATSQSGEPNFYGSKSIWFSYTPTVTQTINLRAKGPADDFKMCVGTTIGCSGGDGSAVLMNAGTKYYIRVNNGYADVGKLYINAGRSDNNDSSTTPTAISELAPGTTTGNLVADTTGATLEKDELAVGLNQTVWYSYAPTADQTINIFSGGITAPSLCVTTTKTSCTSGSTTSTTGTAFALTSGTTYLIRIGATLSNLAAFRVTRGGLANDTMASAAAIPEPSAGGASAPYVIDTSRATIEPTEYVAGEARSVWWSYLPSTSYRLNIKTINPSYGFVCVTTAIDSCTAGSSATNHSIPFNVTGGTQYFIRYTTNALDPGGIQLFRGGTGNDDTANAASINQQDITAPTPGTVFDGATAGVQTSNTDGSLTTLYANWSGFADAGTGIFSYDYSIGTTAGATNVGAWTTNGAATTLIATGLSLTVGSKYFVNVRALDGYGNTSTVVSSSGQTVKPLLSFTVSAVASGAACGDITTDVASTATGANFGTFTGGMRRTAATTVNVTTNAAAGYSVTIAGSPLTSASGAQLASPGTNAAPALWPASGAYAGYSTSSNTLLGTANRFRTAKWAGFSPTAAEVSRAAGPVTNDASCLAFSMSSDALVPAGQYSSAVTLTAIPRF